MDPMLHSFGGHALDRHIFDFEPSDGPDGVDATAAAMPSDTAAAAPPAGGAPEPVTPAGATDTAAAAFTPEQLAALRSDPAMQEWLAEEAAGIADVRFNTLLAQSRGQEQPTPAGQPDLDVNEFLNPLSDNFGENLLSVLGAFAQSINTNVDHRFQPLADVTEATAAAERDETLKSAITDTAGTLGGLKGGDAAVRRVIASVRGEFMPQAMQLYGHTDRAAQVAIDRAIRAEIDYQREISGGAAVDDATRLAAINGARTEPAAGPAGVVTTDGQILKPGTGAIARKFGALATSISSR